MCVSEKHFSVFYFTGLYLRERLEELVLVVRGEPITAHVNNFFRHLNDVGQVVAGVDFAGS